MFSRFKTSALTCALAGLIASISAQAEALTGAYRLTSPAAPQTGQLMIRVYDRPATLGDLRDPILERTVTAAELEEGVVLELPVGKRFAILLHHDENGNGAIDRNLIGIPTEALAFSNNYAPKGPPAFDRAAIELAPAQVLSQTLTLRQPLGRRGQIGVGLGAIIQESPYRGADAVDAMPLPVLVYIGERLQVTGTRIAWTFAGTPALRVAAVGSLRFGAYSEADSPLLAGLGDRQTSLFGGLAATADLPGGFETQVSYQHDLMDELKGGVARLEFSKGWTWHMLRFTPSIGLNWTSQAVTDYEFGVPEDRARLQRPAYRADEAWNPEVGLSIQAELTPTWRVFSRIGMEFLDDTIQQSPLVDRDRMASGFIALTYTF